MQQDWKPAARNARKRTTWLATAAVAGMGLSGAAWAQPSPTAQPPQGSGSAEQVQTPSGNPLGPQLMGVERSLRQAQEQLARTGADAPEPNWAQARRAVSAGQVALSRAPAELRGQEAFRTAESQLTQAEQALEGDDPDRRRAATRLAEAADAVASLHGRLGVASSTPPASTPAAPQPMAQGGAQPRGDGSTAAPPGGMPLQEVSDLIGTDLVGNDGREFGEVENLLVDGRDRVHAALVEWGGFLGIGTRRAIVPMDKIELGSRPARLDMTREELDALPRYDESGIDAYGRQRGWGEGIRLAR